MKTLIIYNDIVDEIKFLIIEGDYSRFNGILVNSTTSHEYTGEFIKFMFNDEGEFKHELTSDISLIEGKQWDKVAITTFLP